MAQRSRRIRRRLPPNRLWKYRRRAGFSQRQVAKILGYNTATAISRQERGKRLPSLVTALKLEIVYGTPVAFLFTDLYVQLRTGLREREEQLRAEREGRNHMK